MLSDKRGGEGCSACELRGGRFFCELTGDALRRLDSITTTTERARGAVVFVEGQRPEGVHVVCRGRVKLSASSGSARVLITDIAGPGDVLGLSAAVSGRPYEVTAEALGDCQLAFVRREDFLQLLDSQPDAGRRAARQLSRDYHTAHRQARLLGLSSTAAGKLASLLLDWCARRGTPAGGGYTLQHTLTQEEVGQLIGASRETVTRLFTDFKTRGLIRVEGATLRVPDAAALEALTLT